MPKTRHEIFQQMSQALAHQQSGNVPLALSYWENVLRLLPEEMPPIHPFILDECRRLVQADETTQAIPALDKLQMKVESLTLSHRKGNLRTMTPKKRRSRSFGRYISSAAASTRLPSPTGKTCCRRSPQTR